MTPDTVLYTEGNFYTLNPSQPRAGSILCSGGKILALEEGDQDLKPLAAEMKSRVISCKGKTVIPAFTDSHIHFNDFCRSLNSVNCAHLTSCDVCLSRVKKAAEKRKPGEWITGGGWNKNLWQEDRFPGREELDRVSPDNPAVLKSRDCHAVWFNSQALKRSGFRDFSKDPSRGRFLRRPDGSINGVGFEKAGEIILQAVPEPSPAEKTSLMMKGIRELNRCGITNAHDMSSSWNRSPFTLLIEHYLTEEPGKRTCRFNLAIPPEKLDYFLGLGIRTGFGNEFFRIGGVKILSDGALGSQTAYMRDPYCNTDVPEYTGTMNYSRKEIREIIKTAWEGGLSSSVHAIGDGCADIVLTCFEDVARRMPKDGTGFSSYLRHRLEHGQCLDDELIQRIADLGIAVSMQPVHLPYDIAPADKYWGDRAAGAYRFRSILDAGIPLAFGSDAPVESHDPFLGIYNACTRKGSQGNSKEEWFPGEKITRHQAVEAYTLGGVAAAREERVKGSLEIGKYGDFIVLSEDIFTCPIETVPQVKVLMTVTGGEPVYSVLD